MPALPPDVPNPSRAQLDAVNRIDNRRTFEAEIRQAVAIFCADVRDRLWADRRTWFLRELAAIERRTDFDLVDRGFTAHESPVPK